ncbi:MAG: periplasmic heavy metal sensor [Pseudomonadota bacterium]
MSEETSPPRRRWLMPVFLLSLAVNLMIVGIVAGWVLTRGSDGRPDRQMREVSNIVGREFFRALEPEERRALVADVASQRDRVRENRSELRDRIERLLVLIVADPFDTDAVRDLLEEQRASVARRHEFGEELLLSRLAAMTPEQRQAFAENLSKSLRRVRRD